MFRACDFFEDGAGGSGPDERFGVGIVLSKIIHDRLLQVGDAVEDAAADPLFGDLGG